MSARSPKSAQFPLPATQERIRQAEEREPTPPWFRRIGLTGPVALVVVATIALTLLDLQLRSYHHEGARGFGMGGLAEPDPAGFLATVRTWSEFAAARWLATADALVDSLVFVPAYVVGLLIALRRGALRLSDWLRDPTRDSLLVWRRAGQLNPNVFLDPDGEDDSTISRIEAARSRLKADPFLNGVVTVGRFAVWGVAALAAVDLAENLSSLVLVNAFFESTAGPVGSGFRALARVVWFASWAKWVLLGLLLLVLAVIWSAVVQAHQRVLPVEWDAPRRAGPPGTRKHRWYQLPVLWLIGAPTRPEWTQPDWMTKAEHGREESRYRDRELPDPGELRVGISCSGGGIRSASYNLGALQVLQPRADIWTRDGVVSAVSGGGYIAASHYIVAARSPNPLPQPPGAGRPVYASGSPEERYLRNHSSYLSPSLKAKLNLALNVLHGVGMNLILLTAWIIVVGRPIGWMLAGLQHGLRRGGPATEAGSVDLDRWMWWLPVVFLLGCLSTVFVERGIARFASVRRSLVDFLRAWAGRLLTLAVLSALVLIALPYAVVLVRWLTADTAGWIDVLLNALKIPEESRQSLPALLIALVPALAGLVGAAYRLLTAKRFSWLVRLAAYVLGPLIIFAMLVAWVDGAAAGGFDRGEARIWLAGFLVAAVLGWLADSNLWSMHSFYKERLASAFALYRSGPDDAEELPWEVPIPFSAVAPKDWPTLVMCAAVNVNEEGIAPPGRAASPFTFTHALAGGPLTTYMSMTALEDRVPHRTMTLPAVMATSGAALAPNMGKMTRSSLRFLMSFANVRLGIWIPNPRRRDKMRTRWPTTNSLSWLRRAIGNLGRGPGPFYLFIETFGATHLGRKYVYVTDGGHFENIGLHELLRRGCTRIYCFDAAGDQIDTFATIGEAIALARSELQVDVDLDLRPMKPYRVEPSLEPCDGPKGKAGELPNPCEDPNVFSGADYVIGTITYPNGVRGDIVFAKAAVVEDAPHDVLSYRVKDPLFPCHPTTDQLFEDEKFEAYRKLGEFTARRATQALDAYIHARGTPLPA